MKKSIYFLKFSNIEQVVVSEKNSTTQKDVFHQPVLQLILTVKNGRQCLNLKLQFHGTKSEL